MEPVAASFLPQTLVETISFFTRAGWMPTFLPPMGPRTVAAAISSPPGTSGIFRCSPVAACMAVQISSMV